MNTAEMRSCLSSSADFVMDAAQLGRTRAVADTCKATGVAVIYNVGCVLAGYGEGHGRDPNYNRHLEMLVEEDRNAGRPLTAALFVSKQTGMPSAGFFKAARARGYAIGPTPADERAFWEEQLRLMGIDPATLRIIDTL